MQPWFRANALIEPVPVSDDLAARVLSLPITDGMTVADVETVVDHLVDVLGVLAPDGAVAAPAVLACSVHETVLIGGGPAGTAMLTAASKQNRLAALAEGLAVVEQGAALGRGELGRYAIRSDSTAETFLSAVQDNVHPELAALVDHPAGIAMAQHIGALGAPLVDAGDLLAVTGDRLRDVAQVHGASILTGHTALHARRESDGRWRTTVRDGAGQTRELLSRNIVLATGGYQCQQAVQAAKLAGGALGDLAGDRLVLSDVFLRLGGLDALRKRLTDVRSPGSPSSAARPARWLRRCCCSRPIRRWPLAPARSLCCIAVRCGRSTRRARRPWPRALPISAMPTSARSAALSIGSLVSDWRRANWCCACWLSAAACPNRAWPCSSSTSTAMPRRGPCLMRPMW
jgi:hypothetical protein